MLKIEHTEVLGWEHAIRGMRNPMNSWEKSDSWYTTDDPTSPLFLQPETDSDAQLRGSGQHLQEPAEP